MAESGFIVPPEGNGHQAEFTKDNAYIIGADEDFAPYALRARNVTDGTDITASQGSGTRRLLEGQAITGQAKFVGRACPGDPAVPAGNGSQVAVVERGVCTFTEKVSAVAWYVSFIFVVAWVNASNFLPTMYPSRVCLGGRDIAPRERESWSLHEQARAGHSRDRLDDAWE